MYGQSTLETFPHCFITAADLYCDESYAVVSFYLLVQCCPAEGKVRGDSVIHDVFDILF